jgi:hypothetical protein
VLRIYPLSPPRLRFARYIDPIIHRGGVEYARGEEIEQGYLPEQTLGELCVSAVKRISDISPRSGQEYGRESRTPEPLEN